MIKKIFKKIKLENWINDNLFKGTLIIGFGTGISQLILLISTPIITRIYSPNDFGIFGLYVSVISLLLVGSSLKYEYAIPIPNDNVIAANLLILCFFLNITISIIIFSVFFLLINIFPNFMPLKELIPFFWILILGLLGGGIYQTLNYWAIRKKQYLRITYTNINRNICSSVGKIVFGSVLIIPLGLIIGQMISEFIGIGTFLKYIIKNDLDTLKGINFKNMRKVAKKYLAFPIFTVPSSFIFVISTQMPVFFLLFLYDKNTVGLYILACQIMYVPISFISTALSQVYYGEVTELIQKSPKSVKNLFKDTTKKLFLIGCPFILLFSLLSPLLFPVIFGKEWVNAGYFCLPLAFITISQFVLTPTSKLEVFGYNKWRLFLEFGRILLISIGFGLGFLLNAGPLFVLTLYGIFTAFFYFIVYLVNLRAIDDLIKNRNILNTDFSS